MLDILRQGIVTGDFVLHSGERATWLFDSLKIKDLLIDHYDIIWELLMKGKGATSVFGIEFSGAILAEALFSKVGIIRKNGEIYKPQYYDDNSRILLFDDVVTTETSMRDVEGLLNRNNIFVSARGCVLDRREIETRMNYPIVSLARWEQIQSSRL